MMRRVASFAAALAVAAFVSAASAKPEHALYGIVGDRAPALVALDQATLEPRGPRVALGTVGPWSFSPSRDRVAIATGFSRAREPSRPVTLRVIDLRSMRRTATIRLGPDPRLTTGWVDPVVLVAWIAPEKALVVRRRSDASLELVTVDVRSRRVVRRQPFPGEVLQAEHTQRELVLLVGSAGRIETPRLVVVDGSGNRRTARLERMLAGTSWDEAGDPPASRVWQPGLAVDAAARTAYVVGPDGLVAQVPLDRLVPSYRAVGGVLTKLVSGSSRRAVALGRGSLAIAGSDWHVGHGADGKLFATETPSGLDVLDTKTWTFRRIEPGASAIVPWRGKLLVTGRTSDSRRDAPSGMGLSLRELDGTERWRLFDGLPAGVLGVYLDRFAFVYLYNGERARVDLATGRVLERKPGTIPWLLLDRSS